jgi:hypothetical protein
MKKIMIKFGQGPVSIIRNKGGKHQTSWASIKTQNLRIRYTK